MEPIPVPLSLGKSSLACAFPVVVLPTSLQRFVRGLGRTLGCPVDYIAVPVLVVAGAALGNAWVVRGRAGSRVGGALFAALVGPPGAGKSVALRAVVAPLVEEQKRILDARQRQLEPFQFFPRDIWPDVPVADWLVARTVSPELLTPQARGFLVVVESLAELLKQPRRARERAAFVEVWDVALPIVEPLWLEKGLVVGGSPVVGLLGPLRSAALRKLNVEEAALAERLLFAFPDAGAPDNGDGTDVVEAMAVWQTILRRLLQERGRQEPIEIALATSALERQQGWFRESRAEVPEALAGTWAKLREYAVRLALVMQALRWACGESEQRQIDEASVEAALQLCDYFLAQAGRVYGLAWSDMRLTGAERIVAWLTEHPQCERFRRREMYKHLWRQFRRPEDLEAPLILLEELGYLRCVRVAGVGRPTWDWIVEEGWR